MLTTTWGPTKLARNCVAPFDRLPERSIRADRCWHTANVGTGALNQSVRQAHRRKRWSTYTIAPATWNKRSRTSPEQAEQTLAR